MGGQGTGIKGQEGRQTWCSIWVYQDAAAKRSAHACSGVGLPGSSNSNYIFPCPATPTPTRVTAVVHINDAPVARQALPEGAAIAGGPAIVDVGDGKACGRRHARRRKGALLACQVSPSPKPASPP